MAYSKSKQSKKGTVMDLNKLMDKPVVVKFTGGREVRGILKGFDQLVNIVLDDTVETLRDLYDPYKLTEETRNLGCTVCRGTSVMLVCPVDGTQEIANPFVQAAQKVI
eukprot:gb/GEZN01032757.1/.p1 GENE.gb/GEZN01032757.1/~~gb/GEZN01032757.1/.p1  ORF type:complete len:108 (+),score=10.35 gb/GEZN01032757.1/:61-384(+)